jgi:hypothetical protein
MGRYEREARRHAQQIQYYYNHAGAMGYSQARYHYSRLSDLINRALRSKHEKSDAVVIQILNKSADLLMQEMRRRQDE